MIDKKQIKYKLKKLRDIKTWQLFILLVLMVFVSATFLRLNNMGMVQRREAVLSADESGDGAVLKNRLYDLQTYVSSHMNADLGKGIYLEASYKRDVQLAYDSVKTDSQVYQLAQAYCMPKFSSWSQAYVQCTANELAKYPEAKIPTMPNPSSYLHVYYSPIWSPDFAGWSVLACLMLLSLSLIRIIGYIILKMLLKHRYKSI